MKMMPLLACAYAGLVLTFGYTFVLGQAGLVRYSVLLERRQVLADNIESLKAINQGLNDEITNLATDAETIRLLARSLGYYRPEENLVEVAGLPETGQYYTVGTLIRSQPLELSEESSLRVIVFLAPALVYAAAMLIRRLRYGDQAQQS